MLEEAAELAAEQEVGSALAFSPSAQLVRFVETLLADDPQTLRRLRRRCLLRGHPVMLKEQLLKFATRTEACRRRAAELAAELGLTEFFH